MKIEELNLSTRPYNILKRAQIDTVEQLRALTDDALLSVRNMGAKSYHEIKEKLAAKPLTNGDRIRAMTDEELAYWMTHLHEDGHCLNERCQIFQDKTCEECVIDWLKLPVEEEE